jgi:hypothetical protein
VQKIGHSRCFVDKLEVCEVCSVLFIDISLFEWNGTEWNSEEYCGWPGEKIWEENTIRLFRTSYGR